MKSNSDSNVRKCYKKILNWMAILFFLFLSGGAYSFITHRENSRNTFYEHYLSFEYQGTLQHKYIDSTNHMSRILILVKDSIESKRYVNLEHELFNCVQPNDYVIKLRNDSIVKVIRDSDTTFFKKSRRDYR